ncbi:MAG: PLP-dependent aminotransferase family protein [Bacteroidota bacterium]
MLHQLLNIDPDSNRPIYRQLSDQLIRLIHDGRLIAGQQLPPGRRLAVDLGLNRNTIRAVYEDVIDQGYLESKRGSGIYVSKRIQVHMKLQPVARVNNEITGFAHDQFHYPIGSLKDSVLRLTEGAPDTRLAELEELYGEARRMLKRPVGKTLSRYADGRGDQLLRGTLASYLSSSRGIPAKPENLLITRGSQHACQLATRLLFYGGGCLAAAEYTYEPFLTIAKDYGATVISIPIDENGLNISALASHPQIKDIRAVYLTPHHQYPTTVTLSADRRLQLLELAAHYKFAILEDDYDYDFHYGKGPLLPLAALDQHNLVLYLGSFTKIIAPNLRIGYLLGPTNFIAAAHQYRLLTDRQGDQLLERALAHYIREGSLDRHLRKVRLIYRRRRDLMSQLLTEHLGDRIQMLPPTGGMATWVNFNVPYDYETVQEKADKEKIWISPSHRWWADIPAMRLGFASLNEKELTIAIVSLVKCLH